MSEAGFISNVQTGFVLLSREAFDERERRRRDIVDLARLGAHPMDLAHQRAALRAWAREQVALGRGGNWLVPA